MQARSRVDLPDVIRGSFDVYVNGVPQQAGADFEQLGRSLYFARELRQEGRLGFWRWTRIFFGIAGTYRQDDSVDLVYTANGRRLVAARLPVAALEP